MEFAELFPTIVGLSKLDREFDAEERATLEESQAYIQNYGNLRSERSDILELPGLVRLKQWIIDEVNDYIEYRYRPLNKLTPNIIQSWLNITGEGEYHHYHKHSNSILSGVFYTNADPHYDHITFEDVTYRPIDIQPRQQDSINSHSRSVAVSTGMLTVFPSSLTHGVNPSQNPNPRVSLAFNIWLTGDINRAGALGDLHIPHYANTKLATPQQKRKKEKDKTTGFAPGKGKA